MPESDRQSPRPLSRLAASLERRLERGVRLGRARAGWIRIAKRAPPLHRVAGWLLQRVLALLRRVQSPAEARYLEHLALSALVGLVLPVALVAVAPELTASVLDTVSTGLLLGLPFGVFALLIFPWVMGELGLFEGLAKRVAPGYVGATNESRARRRIPGATLGLIAINLAVHLGFLSTHTALAFGKPTLHSLVWSQFSHADLDHLLGNMAFLWMLGSVLEARIGAWRFLALYALSAAFSTGAEIFCHQLRGTGVPVPVVGEGSLGASAAIMGVMGAFLVRLHWTRISMLQAILGPIGVLFSGGLRVPAPVLVSFFTLHDLVGLSQGEDSGTAHLAHFAGYAAGLFGAYGFRLHRDALRDHYLELGLRTRTDADLYSTTEVLDRALELDPTQVDAILGKARHKRQFSPRESSVLFRQAIALLLGRRELRRAATVFLECYHVDLSPLAAREQLAITPHLVALGERSVATNTLEEVLRDPGLDRGLRPRVLVTYARLLVETGCHDAAHDAYRALADEHPEDPLAERAREWLAKQESGT